MSGDAPDTPDDARNPQGSADPEPEWVRRRRLARMFGDAEADAPTPERAAELAREEWLKSQVPPHHG